MTLVIPGLVACSDQTQANAPTGLSGRLQLTGSSTVAPLAMEIAKRFEQRHPGVRVDVQTGGSSRGISDARRGLVDIGMASRALNEDEADLRAYTIALDGIGLIVHRDNPVPQLTDQQVIGIYTGRFTDWGQAGGRHGPIVVVHKAQGRSTHELLLQHFGIDSRQVRASVVIGDNQQALKTVAGQPGAIGYVSIGAAEHAVASGQAVRLLPLGSIPAATSSVRDGSYPLRRPLNLITKQAPSGLAEAFIALARSDRVHDLVRDLYFVPIDD